MLEQLKAKLDKIIHKEIKNSAYARHLEMIDRLIKEIQGRHPDLNPDNLVAKLIEIAENDSSQQANMILKFKNEILEAVDKEIDLHK